MRSWARTSTDYQIFFTRANICWRIFATRKYFSANICTCKKTTRIFASRNINYKLQIFAYLQARRTFATCKRWPKLRLLRSTTATPRGHGRWQRAARSRWRRHVRLPKHRIPAGPCPVRRNSARRPCPMPRTGPGPPRNPGQPQTPHPGRARARASHAGQSAQPEPRA